MGGIKSTLISILWKLGLIVFDKNDDGIITLAEINDTFKEISDKFKQLNGQMTIGEFLKTIGDKFR